MGIVTMPHVDDVPVALLIDLFDKVDRMPLEPLLRTIAGLPIPVWKVAPFEASAPIKVEWLLRAVPIT